MNTTTVDVVVEQYGDTGPNGASEHERDESLVDDLNRERGIVSGRVAFAATIC